MLLEVGLELAEGRGWAATHGVGTFSVGVLVGVGLELVEGQGRVAVLTGGGWDSNTVAPLNEQSVLEIQGKNPPYGHLSLS